MSTRSLIVKKAAGGFEAVYCHYDGYPEHHLPILTKRYATDAAVEELLDLGDMGTLGKALGDGSGRKSFATEQDLIKEAGDCWAAYIYVFVEGKWFYKNVNEDAWRVTSL